MNLELDSVQKEDILSYVSTGSSIYPLQYYIWTIKMDMTHVWISCFRNQNGLTTTYQMISVLLLPLGSPWCAINLSLLLGMTIKTRHTTFRVEFQRETRALVLKLMVLLF